MLVSKAKFMIKNLDGRHVLFVDPIEHLAQIVL